jgi:hypothetical protein
MQPLSTPTGPPRTQRSRRLQMARRQCRRRSSAPIDSGLHPDACSPIEAGTRSCALAHAGSIVGRGDAAAGISVDTTACDREESHERHRPASYAVA